MTSSLNAQKLPLIGDLWCEWTESNLFRCGNMVPVSALERVLASNNPGFASVYWFSEEHARQIRANGHSRGLGAYPVASDRVTIDIDTGDEGLRQALSVLDSHGLGYEVWLSGGKGYHILIPHDLIYDARLPYSHLCFVRGLGIPYDASIYQHSRVFRLPGTIHHKTGKRKQFEFKVDGMQPKIELLEPPVFDIKHDTIGSIQSALSQVLRISLQEPTPGNRHTQLWSAAMSCADAGLSLSTTLDLLNEVNSSWQQQKDPDEIRLAVEQAYRQSSSGEG